MENSPQIKSNPEEEIDIKNPDWEVKSKNGITLLFLSFASCSLAFAYIKVVLPVYEATASILIKQPQVDPTQQRASEYCFWRFFWKSQYDYN